MDYRFICLILVIVSSSLGDLNGLELKEIKFNNLTNEPQNHNELDILSDFTIKSKYHIYTIITFIYVVYYIYIIYTKSLQTPYQTLKKFLKVYIKF